MLNTDNGNYGISGFRHTLSYFCKDKLKFQYLAGFSFLPSGYNSYKVDSSLNTELKYEKYVKSFALSDNDNFLHNGLYIKTNNHKINVGIGFINLMRSSNDKGIESLGFSGMQYNI